MFFMQAKYVILKISLRIKKGSHLYEIVLTRTVQAVLVSLSPWPPTMMLLCDTDEICNLWPIIFYDFQFETGRLEINIMVSWMSDILSFYREWDVRKSSKIFKLRKLTNFKQLADYEPSSAN